MKPDYNNLLKQTPRRIVRRGSVSVSAADETTPHRRVFWRVYVQRGLIIAIGLGLAWIILFSGWLNIRGVTLPKNSPVSKVTLEEQLNEYLKSRSLQKNIVFFQNEAFRQYLRDQNPTFRTVNINRTLLLQISIKVEESEPAIVWQTGEKSWLIGDDGRVLRLANEGDGRLGKVVDSAQLQLKTGDKAADTEFIQFIRSLFQQANEKGWQIVQVEIGETTREVIVRLSNGTFIKMATNRRADEQVSAYEQTVATAQANGKKVTEYVDVRVVGKAFYK